MKLETGRLMVRDYTEADFQDYYEYIMDATLQEQLGLEGVTDKKSAKECFTWLLQKRTFLAVVDKGSNRVIGHICLHPPFEEVAKRAEFQGKTGVSVSCALKMERQKQGLMTEAMEALIQYNRVNSMWDYMDYEYEPENAGSAQLQKKLGFTELDVVRFDDVTLHVCVMIL